MNSESRVEKLARLARIAISEEEAEKLEEELSSVLSYVEEVQNVADASFAADPKEAVEKHHTILREDVTPHAVGAYTEDLLGQVPDRDGDYIRVKTILSES